MKVLFISGADQEYGTFHISKLLLDQFGKQNDCVEPIIITQKFGPLNEWCQENGLENYVLPYRYCVYLPSRFLIVDYFKKIVKKIIVYVSNLIAIKKIKKIVDMDNIDIIHTNINRDLLGMMLSRKYSIPNITYLREFSRDHFQLRPLYSDQIGFMNRYTSKFIAISGAVRDDWINCGLESSKVIVIYDGVNTNEYETKGIECENENNHIRTVMCGGVYEGKGQLDLVNAVSILKKKGIHVTASFYGSVVNEKYYKKILDYIESNDISDRVEFLGYSNNLKKILKKYDVGVVCSKAEGFGLVTVEYLLCGLQVVASNTGANPEILEYGKYGYLYTHGDYNELSKAISLATHKNESNKMNEVELSRYAMANYNIEKTVQQLLRIYNSTLTDYLVEK